MPEQVPSLEPSVKQLLPWALLGLAAASFTVAMTIQKVRIGVATSAPEVVSPLVSSRVPEASEASLPSISELPDAQDHSYTDIVQ